MMLTDWLMIDAYVTLTGALSRPDLSKLQDCVAIPVGTQSMHGS